MNLGDRVRLLRDADLNSLVLLSVLLRTQGVSKAAEVLALSQPAVSRSLERLRGVFQDALLVRKSHSMVLTPKARELLPLLDAFLDGAVHILEGDAGGDPASFTRVVSVGCSEYVQMTIAGALPQIRAQAPRLALHLRPMVPGAAGAIELAAGNLDLLIGLAHEGMAECRTAHLYTEPLVCLTRVDGRKRTATMSFAEFCKRPHLDVSPTGNRIFGLRMDDAVRKLGGSRHVEWSISSYLAAPQIVADTDLISVVPQRIAEHLKLPPHVVAARLLFPVPAVDVEMSWHNLTHQDRVCRWVREQLMAYCTRRLPRPAARGRAA